MPEAPLHLGYSILPDSTLEPGTFRISVSAAQGERRAFTLSLHDESGAPVAELASDGGAAHSGPCPLDALGEGRPTARLHSADGASVTVATLLDEAAALDRRRIHFTWPGAEAVPGAGAVPDSPGRPLAELDPNGSPVVLSYDIPEPTSYRGRQIIELDIPSSYFVKPSTTRTPPLYVSHSIGADAALTEGCFRVSLTPPVGDPRQFTCNLFNEAGTQVRSVSAIAGPTESSPFTFDQFTGTTMTARVNHQGSNQPDIVIPLVFPEGPAVALNRRRILLTCSAATVTGPFQRDATAPSTATGGEVVAASMYIGHSVTPDDSLPTGTFGFSMTVPPEQQRECYCWLVNEAGAVVWGMRSVAEVTDSTPCAFGPVPGSTLTARLNYQGSELPDVVVPLAFPGSLASALNRQRLHFVWSHQPVALDPSGFEPQGDELVGAASPGRRASELTAEEIADKFRLAQDTAYFDPAVFPNVQGGDDATSRGLIIEELKKLDEKTVVVQLMAGNRLAVYRDASGRYTHRFIPAPRGGAPALMLVEYYRLSSFPARYGAGRTIKTFSLLPGERTEIQVRSYKRTEKAISQASSILDSTSDEVESDFEQSVQAEHATQDNTGRAFEYHAEARAEVTATWGWGKANASVSGGVKGSSNATREELAKNVSTAVAHNAARASSRRDVTVDTSLDMKQEESEEQAITRTLENVNVSRTLNFVFRQMNQEFVTLLHLVDVRVAFFNGFTESRNEVALPKLGRLLELYIVEEHRQEVLTGIIEELRSIVDHTGRPNPEFVEEVSADDTSPYLRVNPAATSTYRPAPDAHEITVPGVIVSADSHVMRTDGIVVDTFLGRGNGLDEYSTGLQRQAVRARQIENDTRQAELDRLQLAVQLVRERDSAGVELYQHLFPVLPVVNHIGQASITGGPNGQPAKPVEP
ncbi:hypothetical protein GCM10010404_80490 [Nonomuraea africana]|uniref:Uncharacterized protein n=1 Tax=Nonomuraea africana TaxID=46171 RepID=A0ABR9KR82_9ACTN|nr:hypothetical protein [Nonomuraea africana]MBE1564527.1 hypothetical protein [Nonomuraea africana]